MTGARDLVLVPLVLVAVVLQSAVLGQVAIFGVVPDLCLLVVVATGLARGRDMGALVGFLAGLALDLAPPADHVAGRWALALSLVGYVAGELSGSRRVSLDPSSRVQAGAIAAGASLLGTVTFLLCGVLVHDDAAGMGDTVGVLLVAVALDAVVAMLLLPTLVALLSRLRPARLSRLAAEV